MEIAIDVVLVLAGLAAIAHPFLNRDLRHATGIGPDVARRAEVLQEKEAVYAAIKDLEFEYRAGKLSTQDYADLLEAYRTRAFTLLKTVDEAVAGQDTAVPQCARCGHTNPSGSNFCAACGIALQATCRRCGTERRPPDRYCRACGSTF